MFVYDVDNAKLTLKCGKIHCAQAHSRVLRPRPPSASAGRERTVGGENKDVTGRVTRGDCVDSGAFVMSLCVLPVSRAPRSFACLLASSAAVGRGGHAARYRPAV